MIGLATARAKAAGASVTNGAKVERNARSSNKRMNTTESTWTWLTVRLPACCWSMSSGTVPETLTWRPAGARWAAMARALPTAEVAEGPPPADDASKTICAVLACPSAEIGPSRTATTERRRRVAASMRAKADWSVSVSRPPVVLATSTPLAWLPPSRGAARA